MKHQLWVHASALGGYEPATEHLGWVQPIGADGKQIDELDPAPDSPRVAGWRCRCECGWRGAQYYPRAEFPCVDDTNPHGDPAPAVDGNAFTGAQGEWYRHLHQVLPELVVHDQLEIGLPPTHREVRAAVQLARHAGVSWSRIAAVTGVPRTVAESMWGLRREQSAERARSTPYQRPRRVPRAHGPQP